MTSDRAQQPGYLDAQSVTSSYVKHIDHAPSAQLVVDARRAAERAAERSGVSIRLLRSVDDLRAAVELYDAIWQPSDGMSVMNVEVLQALTSAGSHVAGAFEDDKMLASCAAMWGPPARRTLHSHIAGVSVAARGRELGYALKLDQRAWAIEQGVETITWTFDPLVRRNAHFNIAKLGGFVRSYHINHYGSMLDDLNGDDESDRLKLEWDITGERGAPGGPSDAEGLRTDVVLKVGSDDRPERRMSRSSTVLVGIPADIETMRRTNPPLASAWRSAVRDVLGGLLDAGGRIDVFDRTRSGYIVTKGNQQ